jgi:hypothetical protein
MGSEILGGIILLPLWLIGLALSAALPLAALLDMRRKYTIPVFLFSSAASWLSAGGSALGPHGTQHFPPKFFLFFPLWSLVFLLCMWVYYRLRRART